MLFGSSSASAAVESGLSFIATAFTTCSCAAVACWLSFVTLQELEYVNLKKDVRVLRRITGLMWPFGQKGRPDFRDVRHRR